MDHHDVAARAAMTAADNEDRSASARAAAQVDAREAAAAVGEVPDLAGTAVVVMGASGSGKTVLAMRLAEALGVPYAEADDFHSAEAVAKMAGGTPLTDKDRWPWLRRIRDWMSESPQARGAVVTCSALKHSYRDLLSEAPVRVRFLHVDAPEDVIRQRMARRRHFMPPALLASQFATLEPLQPDEDGAVLPNDSTMEDLTERALRALAED